MNRKPKLRRPTTPTSSPVVARSRILNVDVRQTATTRAAGLEPNVCRGEIVLKDVEMHYPARPQRRILNGMSLEVGPGMICALVGQSGGGKSSVISLVQHLYEQSSGRITIDGHEVRGQ
jgi:ABC-type bacteriocin/lantibiotic exporter with double-glycine peptidase domain